MRWICLLLCLLWAGCSDTEAPTAKGPVPAADSSRSAPGFSLPSVADSKPISLEALKGKVVLLDFWATWCGPCRMELPHFVTLQQGYQNKGFTMLGISVDRDSTMVVANFLAENGINYPVVHDLNGVVSESYGGIHSIPTTVLIDKKGLIRMTWVGYNDVAVFEAAIKQLLDES